MPRFAITLLLLFGSTLAAGQHLADTDITQDTRWQAADSPVHVPTDLSILAGAQLTIDPGVTVLFADGASLDVAQGSLIARGDEADPIVFTSERVSGSVSPTAGSWGSLVFRSDAQNATSRLDFVEVRYGHGLVIEAASPRLNNLVLEHNAGAAIDLDLRSSPVGRHLQARHNDINGIRVPAGTISDDVVWALRGIPYVLEQGVVQVGRSAFSLLPGKIALAVGTSVEVELSIPSPAGPDGVVVDISRSVPAVLAAADVVEIVNGQDSASLVVEALQVGASTLSASHPEFGLSSAQFTVVPMPVIQVSPDSNQLGVGRQLVLDVALGQPAGQGGVQAEVRSSTPNIVDLPEQLFFAEGQDHRQLSMTGLAHGQTLVLVEADGFETGQAEVAVVPPSIDLPSAVFVSPGATRTLPLRLSQPAPEGGLEVSLSILPESVASVSATVQVAAGEQEATFELQGLLAGEAVLTAEADGFEHAETTISVADITVSLEPSLRATLPVGVTHSHRLRLSDPAPPGGVSIELSALFPAGLDVAPSVVDVNEGETLAQESVLLTGQAEGDNALRLDLDGGVSEAFEIEVTPALEVVMSRDSVVIGNHLESYFTVLSASLWSGDTRYQPLQDYSIPLRCQNQSFCEPAAPVVLQAGSSLVYVSLLGNSVGQTQLALDSSTLSLREGTQVSVVEPELQFSGLSGVRSVGSARERVRARWHVPGGTSSNQSWSSLPDSRQLLLTVMDEQPQGLIDGLWNSSSGGQQIAGVEYGAGSHFSPWFYVGTPQSSGSYRIEASIDGIASATSPLQTVQTPELAFNRSSMVTGFGLVSYPNVLQIQRQVDGSAFSGSEPLQVHLSCADQTICQVPDSVVIAAGQSSVSVPVTGVGLGASDLVATAMGYVDAQSTTVTVVEPEFQFWSMATTRSIGSERDSVRLRWTVPGGTSSNASWSSLPESKTAQLSIVEDHPSGVVDGIWSHSTGGDLIGEIDFAAGNRQSPWFYIATPQVAGSYRVQAEIDGLLVQQSPTVTVLSPELTFNRESMITGRGLVSYFNVLQIQRRVDGSLFSGSEPLEVALECDDTSICLVPSSVTIPAGQSSISVPVTGVGVGETTVMATADDYAAAIPTSVSVVNPQLQFNNIGGVRSVDSTRDSVRMRWWVPGGTGSNQHWSGLAESRTMQVAIIDESPVGLLDGIWSSSTDGEPISSVEFVAGQRFSPWFYIGTPNQEGSYRVAASIDGLASSESDTQQVTQPELSFSRSSVYLGAGMQSSGVHVSVQRRVQGQLSAAAEPVVVQLACGSSAICQAPESVTIPAGSSGTSVLLSGIQTGATTLSASAAGHITPSAISVETVLPQLEYINFNQQLTVGQSATFRMRLRVPQGTSQLSHSVIDPVQLDLSSNFPAVLRLPDPQGAISSGNTSAWINKEALAEGQAEITASGGGLEPVTSSTVEVSQ